MRYDRGNTPEYWNEYWSQNRSRTETYAKRNALEFIESIKAKSVLDIGCGTGGMLAKIKRDCYKVGVDISETAIKKLKEQHNIDGYVMSAYDVDKLGKKFEVVVANHILEHLDEDREFLETCKKVLLPVGYVFIAVPNKMSGPEDTDKHSRMYDKYSLSKLMKSVYGNCKTYHIGHHLFGVSQYVNK